MLMVGLVASYGLLIFFLPGQVHLDLLKHFDAPAITLAIPVVITAFGYHIVIPSLTTYMQNDRKKLVKAIWIGSVIPILVYLLWQLLVLGVVPIPLLAKAYEKGDTATQPLAQVLHHPFISVAAQLFAFFAIITSFIGVTLSLSHFLTDGFGLKKGGKGRAVAILLTFVPPLFFVFTYPRGFTWP
jgi:tyrosine-specific transport protein